MQNTYKKIHKFYDKCAGRRVFLETFITKSLKANTPVFLSNADFSKNSNGCFDNACVIAKESP